MRSLVAAIAIAVLATGSGSTPSLAAEGSESLFDLAELFAERGLEPLPGQESAIVDGGVAGIFRGSPQGEDNKPYVLVIASPPVGVAAVSALVDVGSKGVNFNNLLLPPLLTSPGRHVIVAYLEDPKSIGEGVIPLDEVAASIDLSALAGGSGISFRVQSASSSPVWMRLIEQSNIPLGLDVEVEEPPDLGSVRATAYLGQGIPGLQFAAGDSATPPPGNELRNIAASTFASILASKVSRLAEAPPFQRVDRNAGNPEPASARPYTGTIPAYTADVEGLLLEGVLEGGPAAEAGLMEGDVIVELAGAGIEDVYDYAAALDTLEIDVPIQVVFLRDGKRLETTLTPRGR